MCDKKKREKQKLCEPIKFETLNSAAVVTLFLLYNVSKKTFTMNLFLALPRQQKKEPGMPIIP